MNSTMTIQIKVIGRQAIAQLNQVQGAVTRVGTASGGAGRSASSFVDVLNSSRMMRASRNLSVMGRQLTYGITIPFGLMAASMTKANLDIERSFTRVRKVYGDFAYNQERLADGTSRVDAELKALSKTFELLSTRFGVAREEVMDIAAGFASAGSAGVGLAKNVKQALEIMILGEIDAAKATESLIAIQAQWGLSTDQMSLALAQLNTIENETGARTEDLIDAFARGSATWRAAGGTIRELGAVTAALVPAAGTGAQAGNALKSMVASLTKPTQDATEALALMGITVNDPTWMGATITERLFMIVEGFDALTQSQKNIVSATLGTRWQLTKFNQLMADLNLTTGYFNKAMEATASEAEVMATYQRELLTVLESTPRKWDIMTQAIRNNLANAMLPLIPVIMTVLDIVRQLTDWFSRLDPGTQKWIILGVAFFALIGPISQVMALVMLLGGIFKSTALLIAGHIARLILPALQAMTMALLRSAAAGAAQFAAMAGGMIGSLLSVVAVLAIVAGVIGAILTTDIEDRVWNAIKNVAEAFSKLPEIVAAAFRAVVRVLSSAMTAVVDLLSYLNPFARHSPSLVDNVTAGVSTILDQYARLRTLPAVIRNAVDALNAFGAAASPTGRTMREQELANLQQRVAKADPAAGAAAGGVIAQILQLEAALPALTQEIQAQAQVVQQWERAFAAADDTLEQAQARLTAAERALATLDAQMTAARDEIDRLANAPLSGMKAMEDQIFANEMAQNRLNLQLLEFEKQGISLDKIKDKYAALNGELELVRGRREDLRLAGAGSDVLKMYDDQIVAIQKQKTSLTQSEKKIKDINAQLDELDLEGRFLALTKSLTFDPLLRQIDQLVNGSEEITFEQAVAGIQAQQALLAQLQPQYDAAVATVERETAAVEAAEAARERIGEQLDIEQDKLSQLEAGYRSIESLISDMEGALRSFASTFDSLKADDPSFLAEMFAAAGAGDFELDGGNFRIAPEGDVFDIEAFNKKLEEDLQKALESMGMDFNFDNIFNGFKADLDRLIERMKAPFIGFVNWIKNNWALLLAAGLAWVFLTPVGIALAAAIAGLVWVFIKYGPEIWAWTQEHLIQPIINAFTGLGEMLTAVWDNYVYPAIQTIIDFLTPVWNGILAVWNEAFWLIEEAFNILVAAFDLTWDTIVNIIEVAWMVIEPIWKIIVGFVELIIIPAIKALEPVFRTVWDGITRTVELAWGILSVIFDTIWQVISTMLIPVFTLLQTTAEIVWAAIGLAIGAAWDYVIKPIFNSIDSFLKNVLGPSINWLFDEVVDPVFGFIGAAIGAAWDNVIKPIFNSIKSFIENVLTPVFEVFATVVGAVWEGVLTVIAWVWDKIATVLETGINLFIKAFNIVAGVINKIAELLGVDARVTTAEEITIKRINWNKEDIPKYTPTGGNGGGTGGGPRLMASGGIVPAGGGAFAGARAIIGEGSKVWPEYVIPTDPRYRSRAHGLASDLHHKLGMGDGFGIPFVDIEDILTVSGVGAGGAGHGVRLIENIWAAPRRAAQAVLDMMSEGFIGDMARGLFSKLDDWVLSAIGNLAKSGFAQAGELFGMDTVSPAITKEAGSWRVIPWLLNKMDLPHKVLSTFRDGAKTRFTGNLSYHALDRAIDLSGSQFQAIPDAASHAQMLAINHAIYKHLKPYVHELIYGGPGAKNIMDGRDHQYSQMLLNEHKNHVHASLATGGRFTIPRRPGGTRILVGEGTGAEEMQVKPLNGRGGDGRTLNFYGDMVFPNITSGDDAEKLLTNLEALAGRN